MNTNLRSLMAAAAMLALVLALALGLLTSPRRSAVAEEPGPPADSPDQYVWTVVYRIATKPEGETVAVPMGTPHQIKIAYTFVKEFQVRPDGTFTFDDCDFGFCRQEGVQEINKANVYSRTNWQGLLRGSGKWQPATGNADEQVALKLESGVGGSVTETQMDGDDKIYVVKTAATTDGRTLTTTSEIPGGKPFIYSYPHPFIASEWTLKPNPAVPKDDNRGAIQSRVNGIPISFVVAPEDECDDKKEQKFQGGRPTTLICSAGPRTPVTETVEVTKRKKEADLEVTFGGETSNPAPGSTGTVKAVLSNNGPCEAHATLKVWVSTGADIQPPGSADGRVEVLRYSGWTPKPKVAVEKGAHYVLYSFIYQFKLPSGATRDIEIEAKDTTPPGQTLPYRIQFYAHVAGDLPDPSDGNNYATRNVSFNRPKKNSPKSTPTKSK
jgi:hypothetical protein